MIPTNLVLVTLFITEIFSIRFEIDRITEKKPHVDHIQERISIPLDSPLKTLSFYAIRYIEKHSIS